MALAGTRRSYHENIVEHYENPRNVGSLDKHSSDVGTVSNLYIHPFMDSVTVFWLGESVVAQIAGDAILQNTPSLLMELNLACRVVART